MREKGKNLHIIILNCDEYSHFILKGSKHTFTKNVVCFCSLQDFT